ncbi:MAG TPA: hypothetical protein VNT53_05125 [Pseudolysinimonas sp.]|nr:hypothetical protein [Pseudolysinimonas sp.]
MPVDVSPLDPVVTALTANAATLTAAAPAVIAIGLGIGLLFWGGPKLVRLLKNFAK